MAGDQVRTESDVERDESESRTRATGDGPLPDAPEARDGNSTTGTAPDEVYVGRPEGQDAGYVGETGAERREAAAD